MKNFRKVLSKTVASVYTAHTYASPYVDTPSRGVTREGVSQIPLYVIKGRNPL